MNTPRDTSAVWATGGLLLAVILHNLIYPISQQGLAGAVIFYALYGAMYVVWTWLLSHDVILRRLALATGIAVFVAGIANAAHGTSLTAMAVFATSIAYHLIIIVVLGIYIFAAR